MKLMKHTAGFILTVFAILASTACQNNDVITEPSARIPALTLAPTEQTEESSEHSEEAPLPDSEKPHDVPLPALAITDIGTNSTIPTEPPGLSITDPLSGTINHFLVNSGNYEWNYAENDEIISMVACGSHPLDINPDQADKLDIPEYNKLDAVPYWVTCDVPPDELIVKEWSLTALGKTDQAADSQTSYTDLGMVELRPERIYEITAVWITDQYELRGFSGQASYLLITE